MALTRITKGVIKPNENYDTHNINSTGIVTAVGANFTGDVSVGGVLTYEDVTSIDSVGIITARQGIHVGAGVSAVGVGTFSGLDISGDIDVDGHTNLDNVSVSGVSTFSGAVTANSTLQVVDELSISDTIVHSADGNTKIRFPAVDTVSVETDGSERLRILSDGKILIGGGSSRSVGWENLLQIEGTNTSNLHSVSIVANRANAFGNDINFAKSRGSSLGSSTIVQDNDELGQIAFRGADGTDINTLGAVIVARVDGSPASNNIPGSFEFYTGGYNKRLIINSSGHVVPGTDSNYDLGLTGTRFRNVYADTLYGDGANITGIVNASISNSAAIDLSKLATGALPTAITVASANIVDGTIVNADVNASAAIAGSKITPNFGTQTLNAGLGYFSNHLNTTGNFSMTGGAVEINLNRASHSPNYRIRLTGGSNPTMNFRIQDSTNTEDRFIIRHGGQIEIPGDVGIGHPVNFNNTNISKFGSYSTLHIKGPSNEGAAIRLQDNGDTADSDDFVIYKNYAAAYLRVNGTDPLKFYMNGADKIIIDSGGNLILGNFTAIDTRNTGGLHIQANKGISFQAFSGSTASRNWRIRNDDLSNFGDLNISCGSNNSTDLPDATSDLVMTFTKERNVIIGDTAYGTGLGQLRINNDASSTPASLSLHGYGNTNTGDVFAKIDFASQENGFTGQVTAGIEAQAVGIYERAADIVFKTRPNTSGSSPIERVRMASDGTTTINGVPAYGAISKTASSTTYEDVFVYDTRKDSDGGAWRHRTTNTSWYNETLNTSIRGARREFPQVAVIGVGSYFIHIFDADDPDMPMWMEFPSPSGGARNVMYGSGNPRCVYMLNGILCTGSQATNYWPLLIDFIRDDIIGLRAEGTGHLHYNGRQGVISLRNSATSDSGLWWPGTISGGPNGGARVQKRWWFDGLIVNNHVTSVMMDVRPEAPIDKTTGMQIPTIFLGTRGGMSIIHSNVGDTGTSYNSGVYDITSNGGSQYSAVGDITITEDGYLWSLHDSYQSYASYRDSSAVDLKRLDNQMNDLTHSPSADTYTSLNNQGGGSPNKGREYYWVSTGAEAGTHRIGYSNTWPATIVERNAWGSPSGLAFVKRSIYTYDHKESSSFLVRSDANRGLVAMITKDYNTGWHMTGAMNICSSYIADGLTSNISAGAAEMLDRGHKARHLDVVGTLTRQKCATGSDLSGVSGFSANNYARVINSSINAGNPINVTMMGWIKITDIGGYSYLCSIGTGSANMGIAIHSTHATHGGKPYFYDSTHGSMQGDKDIHDGEWHHVCGVFSCSSNRKLLYVDGQRQSSTTAPANVDYSDLDTIAVGHWCGADGTAVTHSCRGHLALVKIGLTDLTDQQIKRIYEDEKKLLLPNAKAFLYGSSDDIKAIGYDEKKEIYHVGTSSGRSDFSGLSRINNTTTAVTTAISAYDGLIAEQ